MALNSHGEHIGTLNAGRKVSQCSNFIEKDTIYNELLCSVQAWSHVGRSSDSVIVIAARPSHNTICSAHSVLISPAQYLTLKKLLSTRR